MYVFITYCANEVIIIDSNRMLRGTALKYNIATYVATYHARILV